MAGLSALPLPTYSPAPSAPGTTAWLQAASVGPIGQLGAEGPAPSSQQRHRKASLPGKEMGRQGRTPAPPTSSLCPGSPQHLLGSVSPQLAGPWAAPAQGSVGSCYSVPNPMGHRAIYLDVGPAPPLTSPTLSTSGKAALYAHLPPLYPPQGFFLSSLLGSKRQVTDTPLSPAMPRGQALACFPDPVGHISVEAPQQDGLGSWSVSSPTSLFLFMFLFTNWSEVLQGGRAALPSPWVSPGEFWLEPICRVGPNLLCHPTKDHTVK